VTQNIPESVTSIKNMAFVTFNNGWVMDMFKQNVDKEIMFRFEK
jgi:hypothetical protein